MEEIQTTKTRKRGPLAEESRKRFSEGEKKTRPEDRDCTFISKREKAVHRYPGDPEDGRGGGANTAQKKWKKFIPGKPGAPLGWKVRRRQKKKNLIREEGNSSYK